jgi:hypothetical protein
LFTTGLVRVPIALSLCPFPFGCSSFRFWDSLGMRESFADAKVP